VRRLQIEKKRTAVHYIVNNDQMNLFQTRRHVFAVITHINKTY